MALLGAWFIIFSFLVAIWAQVREICSYAFRSARPKTIPKIREAGLDQDARRQWILDSGASFHAAGDKSLFSPCSGLTTAGTAVTYQARDGRALAVAGVGTISCDNFVIPDVLCVPGLGNRVIVSVKKLAERDDLVMFAGGQCSVRDQSSGKVVGKGRLHDDDGLYHLEFLEIPTE